MVQWNIMDFCTSSNAMIQNKAEGLMRKKAIHIQRKNIEEKELLDHGDVIEDVDAKQSP